MLTTTWVSMIAMLMRGCSVVRCAMRGGRGDDGDDEEEGKKKVERREEWVVARGSGWSRDDDDMHVLATCVKRRLQERQKNIQDGQTRCCLQGQLGCEKTNQHQTSHRPNIQNKKDAKKKRENTKICYNFIWVTYLTSKLLLQDGWEWTISLARLIDIDIDLHYSISQASVITQWQLGWCVFNHIDKHVTRGSKIAECVLNVLKKRTTTRWICKSGGKKLRNKKVQCRVVGVQNEVTKW